MESSLQFEILRPGLLPEWLAFFEGPAFADNPEWGTCYCRCFLFDKQPDGYAAWDRACASGENRDVMVTAVAAGRIDGVLARRDGQTVGWLHFGPASRFCTAIGTAFRARTPDEPVGGPDQAGIVCFLVASSARRVGVARGMLRAAMDELRARGFRSVAAYAAGEACEGDGEQFTGPLGLYLSEGFEVVRPDPRRPLVVKRL